MPHFIEFFVYISFLYQQQQPLQQPLQQSQQPPPQQQQQQRPLLVRSAAPGLSPISQQTIVSPGGNIAQQQSPVLPFQDPNAPPQFQRIQIQQGSGQKPMQQANMVVPVQKPFPENADQVNHFEILKKIS